MSHKNKPSHRRLGMENLERRDLMAGDVILQTSELVPDQPFHDMRDSRDVNGDTFVSALDALLAINYLNRGGGSPPASQSSVPPAWALDTSGDGSVSALDVLRIFNYLNSVPADQGDIGPRYQILEKTWDEIDRFSRTIQMGDGLVVRETFQRNNLRVKAEESSGQIIRTTWDDAGQVLRRTEHEGDTLEEAWDATGGFRRTAWTWRGFRATQREYFEDGELRFRDEWSINLYSVWNEHGVIARPVQTLIDATYDGSFYMLLKDGELLRLSGRSGTWERAIPDHVVSLVESPDLLLGHYVPYALLENGSVMRQPHGSWEPVLEQPSLGFPLLHVKSLVQSSDKRLYALDKYGALLGLSIVSGAWERTVAYGIVSLMQAPNGRIYSLDVNGQARMLRSGQNWESAHSKPVQSLLQSAEGNMYMLDKDGTLLMLPAGSPDGWSPEFSGVVALAQLQNGQIYSQRTNGEVLVQLFGALVPVDALMLSGPLFGAILPLGFDSAHSAKSVNSAEGTLYILTNDGSLLRLVPASHYAYKVISNSVRQVLSADGNLYALQMDGELLRLSTDTGEWTTIDHFVESCGVHPDGKIATAYSIPGDHWREAGGLTGSLRVLGAPIGHDLYADSYGSQIAHFENGDIWWTFTSNIRVVQGGIWRKYEELRRQGKNPGMPVTDRTDEGFTELPVVCQGCFWLTPFSLFKQSFQRLTNPYPFTHIFWDEGSQSAYIIDPHSKIVPKWLELEGGDGFLGYPRSNEVDTLDGTGKIMYFENGAIYWSEDTTDPTRTEAIVRRNLLPLSSAHQALFSPDYRKFREHFLTRMLWDGMVADKIDGKTIKFADQTVSMGFALQTFAHEYQLFKQAGLDPTPSERVIAELLAGFNELDFEAEIRLYGTSKEGFFLRDAVGKNYRHGIPQDWKIISDFDLTDGDGPDQDQPVMSVDQALHMFMGWHAVVKSSAGAKNVERAQAQVRRVMSFLMASGYDIRLPNGGLIREARGYGDFRGAAGFLSLIAEEIRGFDYLNNEANTIKIEVHKRDILAAATVGISVAVEWAQKALTDQGFGNLGTVPVHIPVATSHAAVLGTAGIALDGRIGVNDFLPSWITGMGFSYPTTRETTWWTWGVNWKGERVKWLTTGFETIWVDMSIGELLEPISYQIGTEDIKPYVRQLILVANAFEPDVSSSGFTEFAEASNNPWAILLRSQVLGTSVSSVNANWARSVGAQPPTLRIPSGEWRADNRWVRATNLEAGGTSLEYNRIDYLSLQVLLRLRGLL